MPTPNTRPTPAGRVDRWKKMWGTPRPLTDAAVNDAFDEFREAFVPGHMHKRFLKTFGVPKASFGNRFFNDDAVFRVWSTRLNQLLPLVVEEVEVEVIYGSPDAIEGWRLKGPTRRNLRDIVIDDWHAACVIVRGGKTTLYVFIEPKIVGCLVLTVRGEGSDEEEPPAMIEHDDEE